MSLYNGSIYNPLVDEFNRIRVRQARVANTGRSTSYALVSDFPITKEKLEQLSKMVHGWTNGMRVSFDCQKTKLGKNVLRWAEYND